MSHHQLRKEKNCLNCGETVEQRFCPKCGQENSINRPSFHYLFTHFAEDFVHYDSGFWKTMKTLFFRPGKIIRDYLDGKRKTYMPPVKLYIFVSFAAFFLPYLLPDFEHENTENYIQNAITQEDEFEGIEVKTGVFAKSVKELDSIQNSLPPNQKIPELEYDIFKGTLAGIGLNENQTDSVAVLVGKSVDDRLFSKNGINIGPYKNVRTVEQLDSIDNNLSEKNKPGWASKKLMRKIVEIRHRHYEENENLWKKGWETFVQNLPKALFFYLPIFAFLLWLIHGKKKWLYYDHGVFTLYYFSFLLFLITLNIILDWIFGGISMLIPSWSVFFDFIIISLFVISAIYSFFYFFRAHSKVYLENKAVSRMKGFVLFGMNFFLFIMVLMIYSLITFLIV
ncbi:DUF3667 domain-containing protein [Moheibacter lacus]|uniref:DUF3667 domain-containing protein n=1 Tax=Moheibacter lacus TaxID=2745851 RepID=A0A838ZSE6_9FLAO|nr:DUF3667 domain-containing protein [Moheibacter lacus]MBA5629619.1 DUF3667 domain-containing protein [Moheibacter lacus]